MKIGKFEINGKTVVVFFLAGKLLFVPVAEYQHQHHDHVEHEHYEQMTEVMPAAPMTGSYKPMVSGHYPRSNNWQG